MRGGRGPDVRAREQAPAWRVLEETPAPARRHPPPCALAPSNRQAKAVGCVPLAERLARLRPAAHLFAHSHFAWDATISGTRYVQAPLCYPAERARRSRSIRTSDAAAAWRREREGARRRGKAGGGSSGESGEATASSRDITDDLPILLYEATFNGGGSISSSSSSSSSGGGGGGEGGGGEGGGGEGGGGEGAAAAGAWDAAWAPCLGGLWSEHYASSPREPWVTTLAPWVAPRYERRRQRLRERGSGGSDGEGSETEAD
jgi:hypothetical protein